MERIALRTRLKPGNEETYDREHAQIPAELDAEDVRDLGGRRIELRRSGFTDYSLAGILPRLR